MSFEIQKDASGDPFLFFEGDMGRFVERNVGT